MISKEFSKSDFVNLHIAECDKTTVNDFFQLINQETLGTKVSIALSQRQQGHFDKAMLNMSEANRDQVIAIREIQLILDKLTGRNKTEVIFEKYRQIFPFQIGLTNGEEILNLLILIQSGFNGKYTITVSELHNNEKKLTSLIEEFTFFSERTKGRIPEKEIEDMQKNISDLSAVIFSFKEMIINNIVSVIEQKKIDANKSDKLKLIKNFYLILTSSIETLDAKQVVE